MNMWTLTLLTMLTATHVLGTGLEVAAIGMIGKGIYDGITERSNRYQWELENVTERSSRTDWQATDLGKGHIRLNDERTLILRLDGEAEDRVLYWSCLQVPSAHKQTGFKDGEVKVVYSSTRQKTLGMFAFLGDNMTPAALKRRHSHGAIYTFKVRPIMATPMAPLTLWSEEPTAKWLHRRLYNIATYGRGGALSIPAYAFSTARRAAQDTVVSGCTQQPHETQGCCSGALAHMRTGFEHTALRNGHGFIPRENVPFSNTQWAQQRAADAAAEAAECVARGERVAAEQRRRMCGQADIDQLDMMLGYHYDQLRYDPSDYAAPAVQAPAAPLDVLREHCSSSPGSRASSSTRASSPGSNRSDSGDLIRL